MHFDTRLFISLATFADLNEVETSWRETVAVYFFFNYLFVHRRNFVAMRIRKIQFAPVMRPLSRHPCTIVRKDFMFSPGQLELEAVLDKQVSIIITLSNYTPSNNNIHGMARYYDM